MRRQKCRAEAFAAGLRCHRDSQYLRLIRRLPGEDETGRLTVRPPKAGGEAHRMGDHVTAGKQAFEFLCAPGMGKRLRMDVGAELAESRPEAANRRRGGMAEPGTHQAGVSGRWP